MRYDEYIPLITRTIELFEDTQKNYDLVFMGLSIRTAELLECYREHLIYGKELDTEKVKEKIGWICWYVAFSIHLTKQQHAPVQISKYAREMDEVGILAHILREIGSWIHYGDHFVKLISITNYLSILCDKAQLDFEKILDENIEKLKLSHPEHTTQTLKWDIRE